MNSSRLFLIALACTLSWGALLLAGCASPAATFPAPALTEPSSQTSAPISTQTKTPPTVPSETASLAFTPTASPTPQPTATPAPLSLKFDTAPAFQIIRDNSYAFVEGKRFSMAVSPETGQVAYAGCENGQSDFCTLSVFRLIDTDTG